jgi:hypothetical protein
MERGEVVGSLLEVVPLTRSGEDVLDGGARAFTNFSAPASDLGGLSAALGHRRQSSR